MLPVRLVQRCIHHMQQIPESLIALLGRFSVSVVFWLSAQTKVEGFALNPLSGEFHLGIPHLSASAVALFAEEYRLPFLPPELAASAAALGEHVFAVLLFFGLASRFSALALLGMTMVIQLFVYPDAYPTHGVWATVLLLIIARGPGVISIDHLLARRYGQASRGEVTL
ncbi:MAG: DoxX family membrane protein [Betaproteobacteria bacterium]|nr:DoxX family membrane protein [Betaproteobacteria bacterium]